MLWLDWLLAKTFPTTSGDPAIVDTLIRRKCRIRLSKKLENEVIANVRRRIGVFPDTAIPVWRKVRDTHGCVASRALASVRLPKKVLDAMPEDDVHLIRLAVAAKAGWVVTRDSGVLAAARACKSIHVTILDAADMSI